MKKTIGIRILITLTSIILIAAGGQLHKANANPLQGSRHAGIIPIGCSTHSGTGVYIQSNLVLSAYHIYASCEGTVWAIEEKGPNHYKNDLVLVASNADADIVLYKARYPHTPIEISPTAPNYGNEVVIIGYPGPTNVYSYTKGVVSAFFNDWIEVDAACYYGNSGGPVVNAVGQVIGIVIRRHDATDRCYATGYDALKALLDEYAARTQGH